jgi:hypothetical protein
MEEINKKYNTEFTNKLLENKHIFIEIYKECNNYFIEGHGSYLFDGKKYEYCDLMYEKQELLYNCAKKAKNVLEVGTYMGHSLLIMLLSNPYLKITCIDLHDKLTRPAVKVLNKYFNNAITFIHDDHLSAIKQLNKKFDFFHIDGHIIKEFDLIKKINNYNILKVLFNNQDCLVNLHNHINKNYKVIQKIKPNCIWSNIYYEIELYNVELYTNIFYKKYNKNIYSQNGEDGIVEELLNRLEIKNGWVCEFGAWDGIYLSNTFALIEKGFKGVYIENNLEKYNDLLKTVKKYPNIKPLNYLVDHNNGANTLDNILQYTDIPINFDILSIDIDSYDYQIWKSLKKYKPKIVIIEINSSIDTNNEKHIHTDGIYQGTGFRATFNLAIEKGYTFLLHTGNMFFIENNLFDKINIKYENELENFRREWM